MQTSLAKQTVHDLLDTLPPSLLTEVASFIVFVKMRDEKKCLRIWKL